MPSFAIEVEYAKSNRATCKHCKAKIDKDAVRLGIKAQLGEAAAEGEEGRQVSHAMEAVKWHHFGCLPRARGPAWFKKHFPGAASEALAGFDGLREADHEAVDALLRACRGEGEVPDAPRVAGGGGDAEETPSKTPSSRKRKAGGDAESESVTKTPKVVGFDTEQVASIAAAKAMLASKSVAVLGALLAKNGLPKTGRKEELLDRCAESKALGVPPTCTLCEKVKLRFSRDSGKFSCPGYFDSDDKVFKRCKGPGEGACELKRTPWQE
eukprot:CAMPEP_0115232740 /NCGR_PEP_ID=MMETSP0270-20121206/33921_1 /TAXON_ID=71861 /ORGANISM="Scrippsiella trochoidea, Strain CCMP3099" /LENGTH=267 /DNA_ID=CAMNT_0002647441 /DNA_START=61 /DNA_END=864 /DNA_ORIENTATION=+